MARLPLRECRVPGCHYLTRTGYCDRHLHDKSKRHKLYDERQRDKGAAAFYKSDAWQKARRTAMERAHYLCLDCLANGVITRAEMVHHVKPLRQFPELALVQSNLRPLCNKCHGKYNDAPRTSRI